jgi:indolepyruvate ferredoxin oxidoreductase beta subunit
MSRTSNISLVGVGGQGILLASEILCHVALHAGKDVKKSEVHGMAQRGGSVVSQVRIGDRVLSPLIPLGGTDILVAFEKLEALRFAHLLATESLAIVNDQEIRPVTVSTGQAHWPTDLGDRLRRTFANLQVVPALASAAALGNVRVVNVVMIGALSPHLPFDEEIWRVAISELVPKKALDVNLRAFEAGRSAAVNASPASA